MRLNQNKPSYLGSSETIREALQFDEYRELGNPKHIRFLDKGFLEWFIGFTEGNGSFDQSKLQFIINQKDPKLLFKIKKKLGFGSVFETSVPGIWRYCVTGKKNSLRLYYLFNGNLILEKTQQRFRGWSGHLNLEMKTRNSVIPITFETAWLAGFIEAEGGFYARVRKNSRTKTGFQFQKKFYITQKGEAKVLQQILDLLNANSRIHPFFQKDEIYDRIEVSSFQSQALLLNYLSQFPMLGSKNIIVCIWRKLHGRQSRQEHLTLEGLSKIRNLCLSLTKFHIER